MGFYSLCREGSSSTNPKLLSDEIVVFLFALSRRVFVNRSTTGARSSLSCFYSLCREGSSSTTYSCAHWGSVLGFYSLCREGSSSTGRQVTGIPPTVLFLFALSRRVFVNAPSALRCRAGRWFLFALSRRVFVNRIPEQSWSNLKFLFALSRRVFVNELDDAVKNFDGSFLFALSRRV